MAIDIAQEHGSEGVHVARVVIGGQIDSGRVCQQYPDRDDEPFLDPDEMAGTYWHLVEQDYVSTQPSEIHITNGPQNSEFF
ncbi:hypothetical protein [Halorubrum sp. BOL3-1]|uniref:hypothetical protein n=1 Tax=Halorubrum sp. BOL3-1 TaxID=2497325 RepID=UPI0019D5CBEB|nr:hypothetical protein [Halorubrum sp. BOL3-1]